MKRWPHGHRLPVYQPAEKRSEPDARGRRTPFILSLSKDDRPGFGVRIPSPAQSQRSQDARNEADLRKLELRTIKFSRSISFS